MIRGSTTLIAHLGDPIAPVKAPMVYNPYFERTGIDAVVVPMGVGSADYPEVLRALFRLTNIRGALVTMPHKMTTVPLLDEVSTAVVVAGSCNAVLRLPDGRLRGDLFDGTGFVRGLERKGLSLRGVTALVIGTGGVGSAIAAALAAASVAAIALFDTNATSASTLASRLRQHYPQVDVRVSDNDPAGYSLVVNATPLGMNTGDPLPLAVDRIERGTFVGEVVMKEEITPLLHAARERGCPIQVGTDMLFEQIPLYLDFFGFPAAAVEELRAVAQLA